ncbi:MAG: GNAT family N-acetyltransferase [Sporichthyaceae bacterium]
MTIRALGPPDADASWQLGRLAFGGPGQPPPDRVYPVPGMRPFGVLEDGRLVGKAVGLAHEYWWGGRSVPGVGIASVAIAPERRGRGLVHGLLAAVLADARAHGAAVSALFPTTVRPYRRAGWEIAGRLEWTALPTASSAGTVPPGVETRAATEADVPAILGLYAAAAAAGNGLLARTGPLFALDPPALLAAHDGCTVAEQDGAVTGYASWDRGQGYDANAVLTVPDLFAGTPEALAALLAVLGSWHSVAPTLHLRLRPDDPMWLACPMAGARPHATQPWMLRLVDAPAAVAARGWPSPLSGAVDLRLDDDLCPWNAGPHRLVLDGGDGRLEPGGTGAVRVDPGALALLYAGAASPATLRSLGRLSGGDAAADAFLAAAGAGPVPALLDYF